MTTNQNPTGGWNSQEADRERAAKRAIAENQRAFDEFERLLREQRVVFIPYGSNEVRIDQPQERRLPLYDAPASSEAGLMRNMRDKISNQRLNLDPEYTSINDRIFDIKKSLGSGSSENSAALNQELNSLLEQSREMLRESDRKAEAEVEQMFGKRFDQASREANSAQAFRTLDGKLGAGVLAEMRTEEIKSWDQRWANRADSITPNIQGADQKNLGSSEEIVMREIRFSLTSQALNMNPEYRDLIEKTRDVEKALVGRVGNNVSLSTQLGELEDRRRQMLKAASDKAEADVEQMFGKKFDQASREVNSGHSLKTLDGQVGVDVLAQARVKESKSWDRTSPEGLTPVAAAIQQAYLRPEGINGPFTTMVPTLGIPFTFNIAQPNLLSGRIFGAASAPETFTRVDAQGLSVPPVADSIQNKNGLALKS